mgnify:CR=1 FL=1
MPSALGIVALVFGLLLLVAGVLFLVYNLYWLILHMREPPTGGWLSGLGAGFALLFAIIGLALSATGLLLLRLGARRLKR